MQKSIPWSYAPYKPYFFETGDIYICRVAPSETSVHFEWLNAQVSKYEIFYRKRGEGQFILAGETDKTEFDLTALEPLVDYEFFVQSGEKKSRVRLAKTGKSVGTVVNYLHPDDEAYAFSGRYLCSPSLVRHDDGYLLASMDLFGGGTPQNLTLIFRSDDDGKTWRYVSELMPSFWGKMFMHKSELYMLSCSTEYGDLLIGKSTDGGKTWGAPTVLLRGSGRGNVAGVHKNPQNVVKYKGRVYETLEWGSWVLGYHAVMIMSADKNADLLDADSWALSEPVKYDPAWAGVANGPSVGNIEGTLAVAKNGKLYNIMRYDTTRTDPSYGLVLAYEVDTEHPTAPLTYSHAIRLNGNLSKFMIKKDEKSGYYYSIVSHFKGEENVCRNRLSLMKSKDLETWEFCKDIYDHRHEPKEKVGFQYVDFEIEGDDIIFLCRTAMNDAHNYHDSNYSTFDRIENFRQF